MQTTHSQSGFTLIETLVAIALLSVAIVAPMSLVSRSLMSAYYSRDQVTAYYLAQEGIEAVRGIRDGNILQSALYGVKTDLLADIPSRAFTVDARFTDPSDVIIECDRDPCDPLRISPDGNLYGYDNGWETSRFTRTINARFVDALEDEIRIEVTVAWRTSALQTRSFTISENMYRWIEDATEDE